MSRMLEGVALYLQSKDIVTFDATGAGGDVFIDAMPPNQPNNAVMLKHMGGSVEPSVRWSFDEVSFQILVRGTVDPRPAKARADAIYNALQGLRGVTLPGGTYVVGMGAKQAWPIHIGQDDNNRHRYSLNFWARIKAVTENRP